MATIENSLRLLANNTSTLQKLLQTFVRDPQAACRQVKTGLISQLPESQIYHNVVSTESRIKDSTWLQKRALSRAQLRLTILQDLQIRPQSYLDYGAGEGDITIETQRLLTAQRPDLAISGYAVDVAEWHGHQNLAASNDFQIANITLDPALLKFGRFYDLLPFIPDHSLDVVFVEMVLHHLPQTVKNRLYRTLHRTLSPVGCVIIREHGPVNPIQTAYIHAQHGLYGALEQSQTFFSSYYAKYQSRETWVEEWRTMDFVVRPLKGEIQWLNQPFGEASTFYTVLQKPPYSLSGVYRYLKVRSPLTTSTSTDPRVVGGAPSTLKIKDSDEQKVDRIEAPPLTGGDTCRRGVIMETESVRPRLADIEAGIFNTMHSSTEVVSPVPISLTKSIGNRTVIEKRVEFGVWSYRLEAAKPDAAVESTRLELLIEILSRLDPSQKSTTPVALQKWIKLLKFRNVEALNLPEPQQLKGSSSSENVANDLAVAIESTISLDPAQRFRQSAHLRGCLMSLQLISSSEAPPLSALISGFLINGFSTKEILNAVANILL